MQQLETSWYYEKGFHSCMVIYDDMQHSSYAAAHLCHFYSAHVRRKQSG